MSVYTKRLIDTFVLMFPVVRETPAGDILIFNQVDDVSIIECLDEMNEEGNTECTADEFNAIMSFLEMLLHISYIMPL